MARVLVRNTFKALIFIIKTISLNRSKASQKDTVSNRAVKPFKKETITPIFKVSNIKNTKRIALAT